MSLPNASAVLGLKTDQNVSARVKGRFQTSRHTLAALASGDINAFCVRLEEVINDPDRLSIVELTPYSTVDGEPYVILRTMEKLVVPASKNSKDAVSIKYDLFDAHNLDRLDSIINKQYDGGMKLLAEKRFTYKVEESTEFAILLIWAEFTAKFKNTEALDVTRQFLARTL